MPSPKLSDLLEIASRVLSAYETPRGPMSATDAYTLAKFVRELLSQPPSELVNIEDFQTGDGPEIELGLYSIMPAAVPQVVADLLRAAEKVTAS